jgi:hypothetical protein
VERVGEHASLLRVELDERPGGVAVVDALGRERDAAVRVVERQRPFLEIVDRSRPT